MLYSCCWWKAAGNNETFNPEPCTQSLTWTLSFITAEHENTSLSSTPSTIGFHVIQQLLMKSIWKTWNLQPWTLHSESYLDSFILHCRKLKHEFKFYTFNNWFPCYTAAAGEKQLETMKPPTLNPALRVLLGLFHASQPNTETQV